MRFFFLAATLVVAACGADSGNDLPTTRSGGTSSSGGDGLVSRGDGGTGSSGSPAPAADASTPLPTTCEDACREMSLVLTKGTSRIAFDRAQFGFDYGTSVPKLQLTAYQGGDDACPSPDSKQPSHALQIQSVPAPLDSAAFASGSGITGSLFDFQGDVIVGTTVLKATRVELTPTAASLDATSGEPFFAFDLRVEFEQGIVAEGHVFSAHCASIDQK